MQEYDARQEKEMIVTSPRAQSDYANIDLRVISTDPNNGFKEYKERWLILALFGIATILSGVGWVTFSPIATTTMKAYDTTQTALLMASMVFMIIYIPINFPSNYILDTYGLKKGIFFGVICTIIGSLIRILITEGFAYAILGQCFYSIGQPFLLNAPAKVASRWFGKDSRATATAIGSITNAFGVALGFFFPMMFVKSHYADDEIDHARRDILNFVIFEAALTTILGVIVLVLFKDKPPTPPSASAATEHEDFKESVKHLFTNRNYLFLLMTFTCMNALFNVLGSVIGILVSNFGLTTTDSSILGMTYLIFGIIGAAVAGNILDKTKKYKHLLIISSAISATGLLIFSLVLLSGNFVVVMISFSVVGFGMLSILPIGFELACEVTFPIGEAMSSGCLMTSGQILGIGLTLLIDHLITSGYATVSSFSMVIVCFIGTISTLFIKEDLRRMRNDSIAKLKT